MDAPDGIERPIGERSTIDRALTEFTDDARRDHARRERQLRADREIVAGLSGVFLGTLADFRESGSAALFITCTGSHHRGVVESVGPDVVSLRPTGDGRRVLLGLNAIEAAREAGVVRSRAVEDRLDGRRFDTLLDDFGGRGTRVAVTTIGGNRFAGTIHLVGADQLTIELDGDNDVLTLPIGAIAEAVIER